jgi:hypothetical protein
MGFKLVPADAITSYNAQGKSLDDAFLDLNFGDYGDPASHAYVMLSRLTSLAGMRVLASFDKLALRFPRPRDMLEEVKRLQGKIQVTDSKVPTFKTPKRKKNYCSCEMCGAAWTDDDVADQWTATRIPKRL